MKSFQSKESTMNEHAEKPNLSPTKTIDSLSRQFFAGLPPEKAEETIARRLAQAQIPRLMQDVSFASLKKDWNRHEYEICQTFADTESYNDKPGLLLMGPPGTGKTSIGVAILRHIVEKSRGRDCARFWNIPTGLQQIRNSFGDGEACNESIHQITSNRVVMLDDFGKDRPTDWVATQFYNMIDQLYSSQRLVIITTNCTDEQLGNLDEALRSRIIGMCNIIPMTGPDRRRS